MEAYTVEWNNCSSNCIAFIQLGPHRSLNTVLKYIFFMLKRYILFFRPCMVVDSIGFLVYCIVFCTFTKEIVFGIGIENAMS